MSDRALRDAIDQAENNFSKEQLDERIDRIIRDIEDMQGAILRCQKYLSHAHYQRKLLDEIQYHYQVYWHRHKCRSGPVYYYLGVYRTPGIPNGRNHREAIDCKRFKGKERKEANHYAEILCKKYNCKHENIAMED